ncbi:MAG TPA: Hsp20/alpha crystallin family protein [Natrialbaceae archaeon]|nr:Hsp20/alpha crystallin family protein [Natrialbaceae archaeon]
MRLLDVGKSVTNAVLKRVGRTRARMQERRPLPVDVLESDEAYLVVFDAPGTRASDVQVRYVDGEVRVRIDRFRDFYDGFEMVIPGRGLALDGKTTLPEDAMVDPDAATATLTDRGTLEIEVPKVDGNAPTAPAHETEEAEIESVDDE